MPCNTIQTNSVELETASKNAALLRAALGAIGAVGVDIVDGRVRFMRDGFVYVVDGGRLVSQAANVGAVADLMKQSYGAQAVKYAAARNGWTLRQVGAFAYQVQK